MVAAFVSLRNYTQKTFIDGAKVIHINYGNVVG
jgi:hypothetical protein